jgi:stage II sporulation protein R
LLIIPTSAYKGGKVLKKALIIVFCMLLIGGVFVACSEESRPASASSNVIRLHILANSDTDEDQSTKLQVRDLVLKDWGTKLMAVSTTSAEAWKALNKLLPDIKSDITDYLCKIGVKYGVKLETGVYDFPSKDYNGVDFPEGKYQALRIELGEAAGHNWWCVMFPPLCLVGDGDMDMQEYIDLVKSIQAGDDAPPAPVRSWLFDKLFGNQDWDEEFMKWAREYWMGGGGN